MIWVELPEPPEPVDDPEYDRLYAFLCGRLHPAIAAIAAHEHFALVRDQVAS